MSTVNRNTPRVTSPRTRIAGACRFANPTSPRTPGEVKKQHRRRECFPSPLVGEGGVGVSRRLVRGKCGSPVAKRPPHPHLRTGGYLLLKRETKPQNAFVESSDSCEGSEPRETKDRTPCAFFPRLWKSVNRRASLQKRIFSSDPHLGRVSQTLSL